MFDAKIHGILISFKERDVVMKIKEARKNKHMTQKELAAKIGVDFSVISRYENGTIVPPANRLQAIADVLGVTVDYLVGQSYQYTYTIKTPPSYVAEAPSSYGTESNGHIIFDTLNADRYEIYDNIILRKNLTSRGICELCGSKAPFNDKNGNPYLEIHHIQWLSKGGRPVPENTVALCPNCHRKVHLLNDEEDIRKLKEAAKKHQ